MDHWDKSLVRDLEGQPTANGLLSYQLTRCRLRGAVAQTFQQIRRTFIAGGLRNSFISTSSAHARAQTLLLRLATINFLHLAKWIADKAAKCLPVIVQSSRGCEWFIHGSFISKSVCLPNGALSFPSLHHLPSLCSGTQQFIMRCHSMHSYTFITQSAWWRRCWDICTFMSNYILALHYLPLRGLHHCQKWSSVMK